MVTCLLHSGHADRCQPFYLVNHSTHPSTHTYRSDSDGYVCARQDNNRRHLPMKRLSCGWAWTASDCRFDPPPLHHTTRQRPWARCPGPFFLGRRIFAMPRRRSAMPTYQYRCQKCGELFEHVEHIPEHEAGPLALPQVRQRNRSARADAVLREDLAQELTVRTTLSRAPSSARRASAGWPRVRSARRARQALASTPGRSTRRACD